MRKGEVSSVAKEEKEIEDDSVEGEEKDAEPEMDENAELKEKLLRLAAEFDNYKKRVKKDVENAENSGKASLIKNMLPIVDEFELAMLAINNSSEKVFAKGIEMLYSNFIGTLKKEGLSEIGTDGIYDPHRHEIVMVRDDESDDGTILEVVKKGYIFNGIMVRPASVIISKSTAKKDGENEEEDTEK
jgi:molecular chaperone GrpE